MTTPRPVEPDQDERTEFERFEDLTRRLVKVPKSEIDKARELAKVEPKP